MARYQIPPDPRKGEKEASHAHRVSGPPPRTSPPWLWIGLGAIVTVLAIAVAVLWVQLFLDVQPAEDEPTPSPVVNTATPTLPAPTVTVAAPVQGAETPAATPEPAATSESSSGVVPTLPPAGVVGIGVSVTVVDTAVGLNLRSQPVVDPNNIVALVPDGTLLEVIDGPQDSEGYIWWQLRTADGAEGWAVADFLRAP